jgi:signal transduction histidine kinase
MRRLAPPLPDTAVAVGLAVFEVGSAAVVSGEAGEPRLTWAAVALLLLQTLPVAWARRAPVAVWAITGTAALVFGVRDYPDPFLPLGPVAALFVVVAQEPRRVGFVVAASTVVVAVVGSLAAGDSDARDVTLALVLVGLAWALGDVQRRRDERVEAQREKATRDALVRERSRIARELHDVVAHHVTMMVVQSEAGAATGADGERFEALAKTGREALVELRRLLGMLRDADDEQTAARAPQPGLERIDDLVRDVRDAGLSVDVCVEGVRRPVPAAVALSAYRIVQEALTNTLRHAGPAHATVTIRYEDDALDVEIADDGNRTAVSSGSGYGLVGIRERVAVFGGSVSVGARQEGGFVVAARLPVPPP